MGKILIDIYHHQTNSNIIIQALKVFLNKSKLTEVILVGKQDDLLTIKDQKYVECVFVKDDKNYQENALRKCLELLKDRKDEITAFISCASFNELRNLLDSELTHVTYPCFVTTFANAYTGKKTLVGDLGYVIDSSKESLTSHCEMIKKAGEKLFFLTEAKVSLLLSDCDIDNCSKSIKEFATNYKDCFSKTVVANQLYECDSPLLLSTSELLKGVMSGFYEGFNLYDNYMKKGMKEIFKYKIGGMFIKSLQKDIHSAIDSKMIAGGSILLGYDFPIIKVDSTTNTKGILASLSLCASCIKNNVH